MFGLDVSQEWYKHAKISLTGPGWLVMGNLVKKNLQN